MAMPRGQDSGAATTTPGGSLGSGAGAAGGGLAALLGMLMGKKNDPFKEGKKYLDEGYDPYINQGKQIDPALMEEFMKLMNNPGDVMNKIGGGFKESPGYQFQLQQGQNAANNAAAAGGMAGSAENQQSANAVSQGLANQDYYNYLNKAMGLYGKGLEGNKEFSDRGAKAGMGKADRMSSMAYENAGNKNAANSDMWSNIAKLFTDMPGSGGGSGGGGNNDMMAMFMKMMMGM